MLTGSTLLASIESEEARNHLVRMEGEAWAFASFVGFGDFDSLAPHDKCVCIDAVAWTEIKLDKALILSNNG